MGKQKRPTDTALQINLSQNASKNINEIAEYIAFIKYQPLNATKVVDAIFKTLDCIAQNPYAFKMCPHFKTKTKIYRQAVCLSWNIIYKVGSSTITILGIIHTSRRPAKI